MILIDANLLIYAVNADSPHHKVAKKWFEKTLSGDSAVGLPWIVVLAFLRITTHHNIFQTPLSPPQAIAYIESWLIQPHVKLITPGENHWPILKQILHSTGTAGNLTSDAHIAALAIEMGCEIYSADHDFKRFPSVRHINPLDKR